jgi:hypothetical protein
MSDLEDLRAELDEFAQPAKKGGRSPREERIIAGFEDIQRFVEQHGRAPQHGEDHDIFERIYAMRLDRMRSLEECRNLLEPLDRQGLLGDVGHAAVTPDGEVDDDELLAELKGTGGSSDITELKHVRPHTEIRAAEEIANRERCPDFDRFEPLFKQVANDIKDGVRQTRAFGRDASVAAGNFFILGGQTVYVAEMGDIFRTPNGEPDARLRVIYANGTESNLLLRSLQRALYKDETGRRLTEPDAGPLFSGVREDSDVESGTIYVLRSQSDLPFIVEHRELIHKIGVTGGDVETRIANAVHDATYLLAEVDVIATYKLVGINRTKLENLLHRVFARAQLDLVIKDRFGHPIKPREWFLVPLPAIDEAVTRIRDGSIKGMIYDPESARLIQADSK